MTLEQLEQELQQEAQHHKRLINAWEILYEAIRHKKSCPGCCQCLYNDAMLSARDEFFELARQAHRERIHGY